MNGKQIQVSSLLLAGFATSSALAVDGFRVSGHVDAQYEWVKDTTNTFVLDEANVAFERKLGPGEVVLDLAIASERSTTGTSLSVGVSGTSQAYVGAAYENGFRWRAGQWQSPFGAEAVYSNLNRLSEQGLIYASLPSSHVGALVGYDFSDMLGVQLWLANRRDSSLMPYASANPDLGFLLSTKVDTVTASVGGLFGRQNGASDWMLDVVLGATLGSVSTQIETNLKKVGAGTGFGMGLFAGYDLTTTVGVAGRVEFTKDLSAAGKVVGVAVGPQYKITESLVAKTDYTLTKVLDGGGTGHAVTIAAVHSF